MNCEGKVLPVVLAFTIIIQLIGGFIIDQTVKNRHIINVHSYQKYSYHMTEASLQWYLHNIYSSNGVEEIADYISISYSDLFTNEILPHEGIATMRVLNHDEVNQLLYLSVETTTIVDELDYYVIDRIDVILNLISNTIINRTKTAF